MHRLHGEWQTERQNLLHLRRLGDDARLLMNLLYVLLVILVIVAIIYFVRRV